LKKILLLLIIPLLFSCTFSDENSTQHEKESHPTLILQNAKCVIGQNGENPIEVEGTKIEFYSDDNIAMISKLSFKQKDENGNVSIEGKADYCKMDTYSKTMNLDGNVSLVQSAQNMEIKADSIYFDLNGEEISADGFVIVKSEKGDFSGHGFHGDLKEETYSFESIEEGTIRL